MAGGMFLRREGELVPLGEQLYTAEDDLQTLLERHPDLLAGDGPSRHFVLVSREFGIASELDGSPRWSIDHLFVDDGATPTLVEVKRSTDTRIRREVVGQMLDYAANALTYWSLEMIRARFEARCGDRDPAEVLAESLGDNLDIEEFWGRVATNLSAGRVRLMFVADTIPAELIQTIVDRANTTLKGTGGTLTGVAAVDRDFLHALFGSFPYVLALVMTLTLILLTRAFRSIVLAIKAVLLNLLSLAAAFGIVVFVFQQGHGSSLWNIAATQSITAWIPVMIFAFLFGLSMDYEVFMLTRMREAYDETRSTNKAIELGLARTGKLVTSGALILMFAFLVLSTSPGYEVKPLAIGLAAGIILDATVIRALLVPALMRLLGEANWWMPNWTRDALRIPRREPVPPIAADSP